MNMKMNVNGDIVNGWKNNANNIGRKKSVADNGGNINAMNRKCDVASMKVIGSGGIVNGWKKDVMKRKCAR